MDRATKAAVLVSALAAIAFEAAYAGGDLWYLPRVSLAAACLSCAAARLFPDRIVGAVLAAGSLVPFAFMLMVGHFRLYYLSVWVVSLFAAAAGAGSRTALSWHFPPPIRLASIAWALSVALVWPIVALRELDWTPSLLWSPPLAPSSAVHAIPTTVWIAEVAQVHLLGLLLIDWLFGRTARSDADRFERTVIWPMLAAAAIGAAVATYQGIVDLRFASLGGWAEIGRAGGVLTDGNASGSLAALWVAVPVALMARARSAVLRTVLAVMPALLIAAVWMTGSRTALLGGVAGLAAAVHILLVSRRVRWIFVAAAAAVLGTGVAVAQLAQPDAVGPVSRVRSLLPDLSPPAVRAAARELWERNGYGRAAVQMIADEPLHGVGLGTFHIRVVEYTRGGLSADNAQNWYRHQLAELGVLGSLGWMLWVAAVARTVAFQAAAPEHRTRALALRYTLAGFAAASLLGMPGQNLIVALTLFIFVYWLLILVGPPPPAPPRTGQWPASAVPLALASMLALLTWHAGWRELRPPFRAKRFDLGYRYGFYEPFDGAAGRTLTSAHAVAVAPARKPWLKLWVRVDHPDANEHPVRVEVWRDRERVISGRFGRGIPLVHYVRVGEDANAFVLETRVDRTFAPADRRYPQVGLALEWEFVDSAPAAARD